MDIDNVLVIDLFAGPGGLGEGISSAKTESGQYPFKIGVSVEKDPYAHKTLTTRALFRKLKYELKDPCNYYRYLHGEITREQLFELHPEQAAEAEEETLGAPRELGKDNDLIHSRISQLVSEHSGPKVVIGGPPCQAYSLAGRSRNAGNKEYVAKEDKRHFLYKEYLEVLSIAQPHVFVMENVKGILSAKIDGEIMFPSILEDLREPGKITTHNCDYSYKIYSLVVPSSDTEAPAYKSTKDYLINCEEHGIPQARHRVILLGVRSDINAVPGVLEKANAPVTVRQTIDDLPKLRSGFSKQKDITADWETCISENASKVSTILKSLFDESCISEQVLQPYKGLQRKKDGPYREPELMPQHLRDWLYDSNLEKVLNHETRGHMADDLLRYAFCAGYAMTGDGVSPKSREFPKSLAPAHSNWDTGTHADRFRVQVADRYATTVTSHISKDGHYFVHYDPKQCRSLTVREAARLQTFPDNYFFEGNRTNQYVQVGNAVPPLLAYKIGVTLLELFCLN
ncbi:DNA cytosine methyltransferase [Pseudoalteromonas sp. DL2-H2.2]|uniref:DNA cytosine methyltransferase n=1 Tax=Pseudoalteromonas sp. DL2-H2.2 TaxID=2908889 RepID=UPI001F3D4E42|nr:DNA cytosine methyltransferase [Pseudoalteromonas sp. DL2-H2.2]MCF2909676.1 DNA cytosine methyltransferase [Pseudoalteromonas sp. DL2-H2.2]